MKDSLYFPHDSNASNDPKILALRGVYGSAGYGNYWMIVELLREQEKLYRLHVRPVANIDRNMKSATVRYLLKAGCLSTLTVTQLRLAGYADVPQVMREFPDDQYPGRGPIGWKAERKAA